MQGTPSSFGDVERTGGILTTPSRSGIDPRVKVTSQASAEAEAVESEGYDAAFVAAALEQGGFGRKDAISTGAALAQKLKRAMT